MYHYYKVEVLENFTIERKMRSFGRGILHFEHMKKGEVIHSLHGIDSEYNKAIDEGKIKVLETR